MKGKISIMGVCICGYILTGCFVRSRKFWDSEKNKVEECRSKWIHKDLPKEQQITVLLFTPKSNRDIYSYPNFLIGVTEIKDTIAFIDKHFEGEIRVGVRIKLLPFQWSEAEKTINKPIFTVHKKSKENDLYCIVKTVYYGKIEINKAAK